MRTYGLVPRRFLRLVYIFQRRMIYICSVMSVVKRYWKSAAGADIPCYLMRGRVQDLSSKQLDNAEKLLEEQGYHANLICLKMEDELDVPHDYFDYVYSIYGIGWTTDLQGTFDKIASYLKKDGIFIFSWHHTLNYCIAWSCDERKDVLDDDKLIMSKCYYDESYFKMPVHDSEIVLCNRKMSTYINALAKAGFVIEQLIEETDEETMNATGELDAKTRKAKMLPLSFCIKARKM